MRHVQSYIQPSGRAVMFSVKLDVVKAKSLCDECAKHCGLVCIIQQQYMHSW